MIVETSQVTLALVDEKYQHLIPELDRTVTGKEIHKQLVDNRIWKNDKDGKYVSFQFNAQEFQFRPARTINGQNYKATQLTMGKTVADALLSSSVIVVGDRKDFLTSPAVHYLEVVNAYDMSDSKAVEPVSPTSCSICGKDMETLPRLARHFNKHKKTHPDLFKTSSAYDQEETEVEA